jgi:hypothetical protein
MGAADAVSVEAVVWAIKWRFADRPGRPAAGMSRLYVIKYDGEGRDVSEFGHCNFNQGFNLGTGCGRAAAPVR